MRRNHFLLIFFLLNFFFASSQTLYQPRDVKQAYSRQTRSYTGMPGSKYWQNRARYNITITALPPQRMIRGAETVTYVNNSPDTLRSIVTKLFVNNHKPGAARYGSNGNDFLTDGLSIDTFIVNGVDGIWKKDMGRETWQEVLLPSPLLPHDSLKLSVAWHYPLSLQAGREGMIDSTTFYIAYFYPRIAVYDDYNGWDKIEFTGGQEFYNDFNDYSLTVQVPSNFIVWATGDLLNPEEVLQPGALGRLRESMSNDSIIHIATTDDLRAGKVTLQNKMNSWKFKALNVTDVAAGVSDHFLWDGTSSIVDARTGRRASMQAAYADTTTSFKNMARDGAHALHWFSANWPGVPYPYPKMTAFQGNADMEYPMMINDSSIPGLEGRRVANHEIAHTWFPFYMGINETRYAFMDEAWATTLEFLIAPSYTDRVKAEETYKRVRVSRWVKSKAAVSDLPIITPSFELKEAYRNNAYGKPSLAYLALKDMLGDSLFKKCLLAYMDRWNGKHPLPWDFFYTFNDISGKDLDWFWNNWFFSNNYIDLRVEKINKTRKGFSVSVANAGGFAIPFDIEIQYADGKTALIHQSPEVWKSAQNHVVVYINTVGHLKSVTVNNTIFVDSNPIDNHLDF